VDKDALLSSDLPMSPNDFRTYVRDRCRELTTMLQRRSISDGLLRTINSFYQHSLSQLQGPYVSIEIE